MVHSHLSYCINVNGCSNTTNLRKLRVKQKAVLRTISNAGYTRSDHTKPLFKKQQILPLELREIKIHAQVQK
jgi:hypothetical protein